MPDGMNSNENKPVVERPTVVDQPRSGSRRKSPEDRHFVTSLARGLEVLSCFQRHEIALSNQEIAARCQLPKSTVTRLTSTLTRLGYLVQIKESGRYRLGVACLALGSTMLARMDVRQIARPLMQELADFAGASVSLGMRDNLSMIYIENCRSTAALSLNVNVGSRVPIAVSAIGRAWLAAVSEEERADAIGEIRNADTNMWRKAEPGIKQAIRDYPALGVASSFGDWIPDVNAIARAFDPRNGLPMMALSVGGSAHSLTRERLLHEVRPRLLYVVRVIEESVA